MDMFELGTHQVREREIVISVFSDKTLNLIKHG